MLNHVHKIYNQTCPSYLSEHFVRVTDIHNHRTRSSSYNFHVPRVCGVSSSTFFYNGILIWNALPNKFKGIKSKITFKKKVKSYLVQCHETEESVVWI